MPRGRRMPQWKAKGGDATHITMGMIGGIVITCTAFMLYMYHYHIKRSAIYPVGAQVGVMKTSTQIEPSQLPRDVSTLYVPRGEPVNQPTRGEATEYQQLGILTSDRRDGQDEPIIVPLYGRPMYRGSQKYQYYGASDKQHLWRIPVVNKGKDCTDTYGCDEIYEGDSVTVPTYQRDFTATIYKKDTLRYIPY